MTKNHIDARSAQALYWIVEEACGANFQEGEVQNLLHRDGERIASTVVTDTAWQKFKDALAALERGESLVPLVAKASR